MAAVARSAVRAAAVLLTASGMLGAAHAVTASATPVPAPAPAPTASPTPGGLTPDGHLRPAGQRRRFTARLVNGCNFRKFVWINGQDRLRAEFNGGPQIEDVEMVRILRQGGFTWAEMPDALAVAFGESNRCPKAVGYNLDPKTGAVLSTDIGLWQINLKWHPKYATWNLTDPVVASKAAKEIHDESHGFTLWRAYGYREHYTGWAAWVIGLAKAQGIR